MGDTAARALRRTVALGLVVVGIGVAAVVVASAQGMALVPGGSIVDGYDVGLLPWTAVGTWLIPIGAVIVVGAAAAAIWTQPAGWFVRIASLPLIGMALFWVLIVTIHMAPQSSIPDVPPSSSSLATVVYSRPADVLFLLGPAALLAILARRRGRDSRRPR